MIRMKAVSKSYRKKSVFSNITVDFTCKTYGLLGPNGAGKTTLLRILTGLIEPSNGEISFVNSQGKTTTMNACKIGYLPQKFGTFKELTVKEQMEYFAALKKIPSRVRKAEIAKALKSVNLEREGDLKCGKLSGGMMRRLGIAQAILGKPDLLLLDEPTVGLDPEERMRFKNIIVNLEHQYPIILSTHIVEDIEAVCEEILVMGNGGVLFQGTAEELTKKSEEHVYSINEKDIPKLSVPYYAEKYLGNEIEKRLRILISSQKDCLVPTPLHREHATIEDGYMYLLKYGDVNEV